MAHPNLTLINALRQTATNLRNGAAYAWGNHGICNCGNLIQAVTKLSQQEILAYAHTGTGEWTELAEEFCPTSNTPVNLILSKLEGIGLTPTDIHNLEYLADRKVLDKLPNGFRWLKRNVREDVVAYFETMADMLEEEILEQITIPSNLFELKHSPAHELVEC